MIMEIFHLTQCKSYTGCSYIEPATMYESSFIVSY